MSFVPIKTYKSDFQKKIQGFISYVIQLLYFIKIKHCLDNSSNTALMCIHC